MRLLKFIHGGESKATPPSTPPSALKTAREGKGKRNERAKEGGRGRGIPAVEKPFGGILGTT